MGRQRGLESPQSDGMGLCDEQRPVLCRRDRKARADLLLGGQNHVPTEAAAKTHTFAGRAGRNAAPMGRHLPDKRLRRHILHSVGPCISDRRSLMGVPDCLRHGGLENAGHRLCRVHRAAYRGVDCRQSCRLECSSEGLHKSLNQIPVKSRKK